jgi:hypothetical protein
MSATTPGTSLRSTAAASAASIAAGEFCAHKREGQNGATSNFQSRLNTNSFRGSLILPFRFQ